jgi:quercetin dioxygenase-like cupin family protein
MPRRDPGGGEEMAGRFVPKSGVKMESLDWGRLGWLSRPAATGAKQLTVIDVELDPGQGHNFHKHPDQEELLYVVEGQIEQWIEKNKQDLGPADSAFVPADTVHASFNTGSKPARLLAILGPCSGPDGYVLVDMSGEAPWNSLR